MTNFIIEGVDRLGKGTLIKNLQHKFGFFNVLHYQKPEMLHCYTPVSPPGNLNEGLRTYQEKSFASGFQLLMSGQPFIFDRFHLGETVYSPRYRGYSGEYVFDIEKDALRMWSAREQSRSFVEEPFPAKLILLTTSDFSFIQDDGLSFDFSKKEEEQQDFIVAYHGCKLPKVMIDVSNGNGGYKTPEQILEEVLK